MKKIKSLTITVVLLISFINLFAQQPSQKTYNSSRKCGTQDWLNSVYKQYPSFRQLYEENEKRLGGEVTRYIQQSKKNLNSSRTEAVYYIPVVFHVVVADQSTVPDALIFAQLNRINLDFAGLNADSSGGSPFYSVRGHSKIQFCMAQRTPVNSVTNGIDRITSLTQSISGVNDPIKHSAAGGSDAWDPTKYLNIWVGNSSDVNGLGYGTYPLGTMENNTIGITASEQGIFIIQGSLPGGNATPFNEGRTLTHELGHFFWLRHIWGDETCGNDFPNTPGIDDTPQQSDGTVGCPSGFQATGCSGFPNPPGRMYQNFLDYTDDACMNMFTKGQDIRAEQALLTFRFGLTTSNGCSPVTPLINDASISSIITPGSNSGCPGSSTPLTVTLFNAGSNTLTSVKIIVENNSSVVQTFNWIGNLVSQTSATVNLNAVNLIAGANTIDVCTSLPNGQTDASATNDCKFVFVYGAPGPWPSGSIPLVEGFESTTFPPVNWTRINPDNSFTWQRNTSGLAHGGIADAFLNHKNYTGTGQTDDLLTPNIQVGTADSLWVDFWGAYKGLPNNNFEIIDVSVSANCGNTFTSVYSANATADFAVQPIVTSTDWNPSDISQWQKKSIDLSSFIPNGNVIVRFRMTNQKGNNFFLDDVNIDKKIFQNNDAGVVAISKPLPKLCENSGAPEIVIKNFGKLPLTSVKVNYQLDGTGPINTLNWTGNLSRNETDIVTLPVASFGATGNHSINAFTTLPNNVTDQDASNDIQTKSFKIYSILPISGTVSEDFTNTTFPPANWEVFNPDGDFTWQRNSFVGKKAPGCAWINDFLNNSIDRHDDLALPNFSYSGIDSVFMYFNLAYLGRTLPSTQGVRFDTLSLLLSKDCGNTYSTIYQKTGGELETVINPSPQSRLSSFAPASDQWRRDSVNLGSWLGFSENRFQLSFRFSGNFENNFYLDDINLRTQILPAKLKSQGYLILPNPFKNVFAVWHFMQPTNLRYIHVYNSSGQLIWSKQYPNGGEKYIQIDLSTKSAGIYFVNVGYQDARYNLKTPVMKF